MPYPSLITSSDGLFTVYLKLFSLSFVYGFTSWKTWHDKSKEVHVPIGSKTVWLQAWSVEIYLKNTISFSKLQ